MLWLFLIPFLATVFGFLFGLQWFLNIDEETGEQDISISAIFLTTVGGCLFGVLCLYILIML